MKLKDRLIALQMCPKPWYRVVVPWKTTEFNAFAEPVENKEYKLQVYEHPSRKRCERWAKKRYTQCQIQAFDPDTGIPMEDNDE